MSRSLRSTLVAATMAVLPAAAPAAVLLDFVEVDGDIRGALSGSLDLTGLENLGGIFAPAGVRIAPASGGITLVAADGATLLNNFAVSGPASFGTGGLFGTGAQAALTAYSGDSLDLLMETFGLFPAALSIGTDYVSGTPLSGMLLLSGQSFDGLGITPGSFVYSLDDGQTLTLRFGAPPAAIPLPASLPLLLGGLALVGFVARRRLSPV